ncbi:flavin reductase family protein [Streptomyces sp. NPDC059605]|uniref:flavin reductase family protein n=1 Tax=unclassified Streptomyces TaxID=2593676 RepID=UPI0036A1F569
MSTTTGRSGPTTAEYLAAARTFPTGVTVVATRYRDGTPAKTVSAFASLSLDPLLISVAIGRHSPLVWAARASGVLSVNVLRHDQQEVADHYARPERDRAQPPPAGLVREHTGAPVLDDCLSWFDCRLVTVVPGGDHSLLIGQVVGVQSGSGPPLVHHAGRYHGLGPAAQQPLLPHRVPVPRQASVPHQSSVSHQQGTSP